VADKVCAGLESGGARCWIAPRDIHPGAEWGAAIVDAIGKANFLVLIFSGHANESPQIRREVERAVAKNVKVVPFRIEDVPPAKSLEYFISTSHWMDAFQGSLEGHVKQLAETIRLLHATRDSTQIPPPIKKHTGARLEDGERPAPTPAANAWIRPAGMLAAAAALAALYFFVLRKSPPEIKAVNFPPVIVAGGKDAVGTVQFEAGPDDVAQAEFTVVSAEKFEPFSVKPSVAGERHGSIAFGIRSRVPQQVTLQATLVDAKGRRSRPVSFSFEVRRAAAAERTIEIPIPHGFKLKLPR
jgi:hypothetical protein